jgi:hypothetical protein
MTFLGNSSRTPANISIVSGDTLAAGMVYLLDAAHLQIELDADLVLRSSRYRVRRPTDFDECQ